MHSFKITPPFSKLRSLYHVQCAGGKRRKHTRGRVNRAVEEIFRRRCAHFLLQLQTIRQKRIFRHNFLHNKEKKTRILVEMPFFECKNCKPH